MSSLEKHIGYLFTAELQFRLASAVRIAAATGDQPLDLPMEWVHGQHRVFYEEVALRQDQGDFAAHHLQRSATYLMAVAIKDAIKFAVPNPKSSPDSNVSAAYQISRLIRNAFAHSSFSPTWSIDPDCTNKAFAVDQIITFDTTNLQGVRFDWRHYGGPLALFRLCRFARTQILNDKPEPRKVIPLPRERYVQQGGLILKSADEIPEDAVPVEDAVMPDGSIDLGDGHSIKPTKG